MQRRLQRLRIRRVFNLNVDCECDDDDVYILTVYAVWCWLQYSTDRALCIAIDFMMF